MSWQKVLLAVLVMIVFGLNAVFSKLGLLEFPPLLFTLLRFLILLPGIFFVARPSISWPMLIAITFTLSIGFLLFANVGLKLGATAGTYAFIQQTGSIFALFAAFLLLGHRPSLFDIGGIVLGLIGIYWISTSNGIEGSPLALFFLVASAITWGFGFTLVKKAHAPSIPTIIWTSIFVIPFLAIASVAIEGKELILSSLSNASPAAWATVFFSGWVSMLGAGGILMYLMRTEQVAKVVPFNMLVPVTACLFSYLLLGEQLTQDLFIGGAWILSGLVACQIIPKLFRGCEKV